MVDTKFSIAQSGRPNPENYSFISTLTHEFKGQKEVLGYSNLDQALKWDTQEQAEKVLSELPDWAKGKHEVIEVEPTVFGFRYAVKFKRGDFI